MSYCTRNSISIPTIGIARFVVTILNCFRLFVCTVLKNKYKEELSIKSPTFFKLLMIIIIAVTTKTKMAEMLRRVTPNNNNNDNRGDLNSIAHGPTTQASNVGATSPAAEEVRVRQRPRSSQVVNP